MAAATKRGHGQGCAGTHRMKVDARWVHHCLQVLEARCCGGNRTLLRVLLSAVVGHWGEWELCLGLPEQGDCAVAVHQPPVDRRR
ncbi:hypothetical protein NDU88_004435 [Pleurodeles waltl]|uniref:Uncharacterized protein n=1 Tax=Pleurodeles waltl TaxID=8319 RepID=A0AAV7PF10_PLEWA|nr:hypothetical protein NDU88_004435 [Pleurodeles waltl]